MKALPGELPGVFIFKPQVFGDEREVFFESFNVRRFSDLTGVDESFVQDNHSCSSHGVLRGLHYQIRQPQGKLVRVVAGEVFDVIVDLRRSSPTFGKWEGFHLSARNKRMVWIPEGFAHGFLTISATAEFLYKTTDYWAPEHERCIRWDDSDLGIDWPINELPTVSVKDSQGLRFMDAEVFG